MGTMNPYLEDPTRKMLSRPVIRRTQPIEMPDRLEMVVRRAASDDDESVARQEFEELCRLLLDQRAERLQMIGISALDGDRVARLQQPAAHQVIDVLWALCKILAGRPEVAMTLGPLQDALEYVQTSLFDDYRTALDIQITQKLLPMLRGGVAVLDQVDSALGQEYPRSIAAVGAIPELANANQDRIKPRF